MDNVIVVVEGFFLLLAADSIPVVFLAVLLLALLCSLF